MELTEDVLRILGSVYAGINGKSKINRIMFREAVKGMVNDEEFWAKAGKEAEKGMIDASGMTDAEVEALCREHGIS